MFTDLDKLAEHLTALVPEDGKTFDELVYGVKRLRTFDPIELTVATLSISSRRFRSLHPASSR